MKIAKKICSFTMIVLFMSLALAPVTNAADGFSDTFEIEYSDENGDFYSVQVVTNQEQLEDLETTWCSWEGSLIEIRSDGKIDSKELAKLEQETITMFDELKNLTYNPITGEYLFPIKNIPAFIHDNLLMIGGGLRIFSIGRGRVWLPFNRQGETFVGKRFAPIFIRHGIGFSRIRSCSFFPLTWFVLNRFFTHWICTMGFTGLYINLGKHYVDKSVGPVILIGKPRLVTLSDDFL